MGLPENILVGMLLDSRANVHQNKAKKMLEENTIRKFAVPVINSNAL